jgi:TldD protein
MLQRAGVDYADARYLDQETESITVRNEQVTVLSRNRNRGFGIRVLYRGSWGFAASSVLSSSAAEAAAKKALEIAKASRLMQKRPVKLDDSPPYVDTYRTDFSTDPFTVPLDDKLELLFTALLILRQDKRIQMAEGIMNFFRTKNLFLNSGGAEIEQELLGSGAGIVATAIEDGEVQRRSYPMPGGDFAARGYEFVEEMKLLENAERVREEAIQLLTADECPSGKKDIIIDSSQLSLQIHESCGHAAELDRALGTEISYAGGSFLTPDKLGKLRYGSRIINIYADATIPGSIGSFGYDDEGVKAQRFPIIKEGVFVGYLTSRDTAPLLGQRSNGAMRAESWGNIPLIRMTNVSLEPGDVLLDDLIAETHDGIFISTSKSWSIDDLRLNFQFGCETAWEIKHGKLGRMLKNPVYMGITPEFWNSCDAVCNEDHWKIWGHSGCAKGEPSQLIHVGHGAAPARFRKVEVGVQ